MDHFNLLMRAFWNDPLKNPGFNSRVTNTIPHGPELTERSGFYGTFSPVMDQPCTLFCLLVSVFADFYQGLYDVIEGVIIVIKNDQIPGILFILIFQYIN